MRKTFLAWALSLIAFAGVGFVQWTNAFASDPGPTAPLPGQSKTKPGEGAKADGTRPGLLQGWFGFLRRGQTQTANCVKCNAPARPSGASTKTGTMGAAVQARFPNLNAPVSPNSTTEPRYDSNTPGPGSVLPTTFSSPADMTIASRLEVSGHDKNYRWITGVLTRKQGLAHVWFIRYLPPDALPDWHYGCVAIQTSAPMDEFREGDLVSVSGYIITNVEVAPGLRVTGYAAEHVNQVK
jgi:hypothetical protein